FGYSAAHKSSDAYRPIYICANHIRYVNPTLLTIKPGTLHIGLCPTDRNLRVMHRVRTKRIHPLPNHARLRVPDLGDIDDRTQPQHFKAVLQAVRRWANFDAFDIPPAVTATQLGIRNLDGDNVVRVFSIFLESERGLTYHAAVDCTDLTRDSQVIET